MLSIICFSERESERGRSEGGMIRMEEKRGGQEKIGSGERGIGA